jgi:hypothetical protein
LKIPTKLLLAFLSKISGKENELVIPLCSSLEFMQRHTPIAVIPLERLWEKESLNKKVESVTRLKWMPSENLVKNASKETFQREIFGEPIHFGEHLFHLYFWHCSRKWDLSFLRESDIIKSDALETVTALTRMRYWHMTSKNLELNLPTLSPMMVVLVYPMVVKIPIKSFKHFFDIHSSFSFNSIRKAKHKSADLLIDYLYDVLFLQQKLAVTFHELVILVDSIRSEKKGNILHR